MLNKQPKGIVENLIEFLSGQKERNRNAINAEMNRRASRARGKEIDTSSDNAARARWQGDIPRMKSMAETYLQTENPELFDRIVKDELAEEFMDKDVNGPAEETTVDFVGRLLEKLKNVK